MDNHFFEESGTDNSRYRALLSGAQFGLAEYDQPLMELQDCVVTPTLGSIVPNWLLVIPREHKVNFADWRLQYSHEPLDIISELLDHVRVPAHRAIWFEHGPDHVGSVIGCGVDHAHLHVLIDPPFVFEDFVTAVRKATDLDWMLSTPSEVYSSLPQHCSYLVAGGGDETISTQNTSSVGSQFFRRIIANLSGQPEAWNYKTHPHIENVRTTISTFQNLTA